MFRFFIINAKVNVFYITTKLFKENLRLKRNNNDFVMKNEGKRAEI